MPICQTPKPIYAPLPYFSALRLLFKLSLHDMNLRALQTRKHLPAAMASVSYGFVIVRVRVRVFSLGEVP